MLYLAAVHCTSRTLTAVGRETNLVGKIHWEKDCYNGLLFYYSTVRTVKFFFFETSTTHQRSLNPSPCFCKCLHRAPYHTGHTVSEGEKETERLLYIGKRYAGKRYRNLNTIQYKRSKTFRIVQIEYAHISRSVEWARIILAVM